METRKKNWQVAEAAPAQRRKLLLSLGRGMAYGFEANENSCWTPKYRGADAREEHLGKLDGQTSLDRFQARCKWEMSD